MTQENVISRIRELKELEEMADELTGMIESIKDELKLFMQEEQTEEYDAGAYIMRYTTVLSNRFDSTAFKKVMPDVYKAYTKQVTRHKPEILRLIIRHEMIHAALWQTGLPCGDKDILFMAIAGCYNANPRFPHRVKVPEDVKNVEEWFFNHLASLNK